MPKKADSHTVNAMKDLWCGIVAHKWKTVTYIFTCFCSLFTIVKVITQFFDRVEIKGMGLLAVGILISVGWGLWKVWKPSKVTISIPHTATCLEIAFGDLFVQSGVLAIGVSEFFETELGNAVSEKSLHGAFLKHCFSGYQESIDRQLDIQLATAGSEHVPEKREGKKRRYSIGTTALITANESRYLLFAIAKTNSVDCKVSSDEATMWEALHCMWQRARVICNGDALNVPLVGSGLAGLGLPTRNLLDLVILSAITESKAHEVTRLIRIVLRRDRFEDIDLREVKEHWEK